MNQYKVCVYAICKNESQFVDRWMDSMSEADIVVVTDTGSTDDTVEKLQKRGAIVYSEKINPWRFDAARNASLSHVPEDMDICVCTDLDEVFSKGWRNKVEAAWDADVTSAKYLYNWSLKSDGTPDVQFAYFKIHSRFTHKWIYPVHECTKYIGEAPEKVVFIEGIELTHYPDQTKSRSNYLPLLELAVEENPIDSRMRFYLGREYTYLRLWQKAIAHLKIYLQLPLSLWKEERADAMRLIAKSFGEQKNYKSQKKWLLRAIAEVPHMREPYVEAARAAYLNSDWEFCLFSAENALKITKKSETYISLGYAWDFTPFDLAAIAAYRMGLLQRSLLHAQSATDMAPENKRLQANLAAIYSAAEQERK